MDHPYGGNSRDERPKAPPPSTVFEFFGPQGTVRAVTQRRRHRRDPLAHRARRSIGAGAQNYNAPSPDGVWGEAVTHVYEQGQEIDVSW